MVFNGDKHDKPGPSNGKPAKQAPRTKKNSTDSSAEESWQVIDDDTIADSLSAAVLSETSGENKCKRVTFDPNKTPIPPKGDKLANDYDYFKTQMLKSIDIKRLDAARKNIRYHVNNPNFAKDMIVPFKAISQQVQDIENRAEYHDTTEPHSRSKHLYWIADYNAETISTRVQMAWFIDNISRARTRYARSDPTLWISGHEIRLGKNGSMSLLVVNYPRGEAVGIIDVETLQAFAFTTTGFNNKNNLKTLLENEAIDKGMWDCRELALALHKLYNVKLRGVIDVQLMENAVSGKPTANKSLLNLDEGVKKRLQLRSGELMTFLNTRKMAQEAMTEGMEFVNKHREKRGTHFSGYYWMPTDDSPPEDGVKNHRDISAIIDRPLHPEIREFCRQDVLALRPVFDGCRKSKYWVSDQWYNRINEETQACLRNAQSVLPYLDPMNMNQPPKGWPEIERKKVSKASRWDD